MINCHHCLRPMTGPVQSLLPQSQRLKEGRAAHLRAQAGHFVLLLSQGVPSWHCQHNATWLGPTCWYHALRARGMCSALCRPQRQSSPTSAFIGMARDPCLAACGLPAQLVRVMSASTTLPMCSRRLRSAAAREISISVICRETAPAPYGIRRAPRAGRGQRGTPDRPQGRRAPASFVGAVSHPRFGTCHSLPGIPPLLTISSRSSFLMVTFASSFSLQEDMDKPLVTNSPRRALSRCSLGYEAGRSDPSQQCGAGRGPGKGQDVRQGSRCLGRVSSGDKL